jgi:hypothetical protein
LKTNSLNLKEATIEKYDQIFIVKDPMKENDEEEINGIFFKRN